MIWLMVCDDPASASEDDDERESSDQRPPAADPTGNPAGDQHGDRRHHEVAGEEQLTELGDALQLLGQGRAGRGRPGRCP